jgi:DNA primase
MSASQLHPDTVEEVKQRLDIVDIVSDCVVLKKKGKDFSGLCPFHDEKSPSFTVSPNKQLYYCFGCGAGGDGIKFLMELGKQSFSEVVLDLAKRYQIPIKTLEPEQKQEIQKQISIKEELYEILAVTNSFYEYTLRQPQGEIALNYLQQDRGLQEETIQQFQLGFAPAGWDTLYRYLVEQKRFPVNAVIEAGLIKKRSSGDGYIDVFRDRITIPIADDRGRIIAFGSRTLKDEKPKYLNSPETILFEKSKILFALDKARKHIIKEDKAIVVEGYFDVIALHAAGIDNTVASLGTALSEDGVKLLSRYSESKQIIFNFDADRAGIQATQRAIQTIEKLVYSGQIQLKILNLPDGKDADEFLRTGTEAIQSYRNCIENAPLWIDWKLDRLVAGEDLTKVDRLQYVARNMVKLLNELEDVSQRTYYLNVCANILSGGDARLTSINLESLQKQLKKPVKKANISVDSIDEELPEEEIEFIPIAIDPENELLAEAEYLLLLLYLHCPQQRQEIINCLEDKDLGFSFPQHRFIWLQMMDFFDLANEDKDNKLLTEIINRSSNFPKNLGKTRSLLYLNSYAESELYREDLTVIKAIATIEQARCKRKCLEYTKKWQQLHPVTDRELMAGYHREIIKLQAEIKNLENQRVTEIRHIYSS